MKTLSFPKNVRIPSGDTATYEEMKTYGTVIQKFIKDMEDTIKSETDTKRHNDAVEYLNHIANHYNHELQRFNKAQQKRQVSAVGAFVQRHSA